MENDLYKTLSDLSKKISELKPKRYYGVVVEEDIYNKIKEEYPNLEEYGIELVLMPMAYIPNSKGNVMYLIEKEETYRPAKLTFNKKYDIIDR